MTKRIRLSYGNEVLSTSVSNIFIDEYMADANGSYVKVYIYLLRCLGDPSMSISIAAISDKLEETEKDIVKALKYWEKKKLLNIFWDCDGQINSITFNPLSNQTEDDNVIAISSAAKTKDIRLESVSEHVSPEKAPAADAPTASFSKPNYSAKQLSQFKEFDDYKALIDYIESRLGCTMKLSDLQTPAFLYEQLGMPADLIRFLYDYCIYKDKKSNAYIEKVAISWNEKEIDSVSKARAEVFSRSKEVSAVKSAFGITRTLGAIELEFIDRWRFTYNMDAELLREACNRTLLKTGKPDFKYTDSILSDWHNSGVTCTSDIAKLDEAHVARAQKAQNTKKAASSTGTSNKFNQFPQRSYTSDDYDDLESRKLSDF